MARNIEHSSIGGGSYRDRRFFDGPTALLIGDTWRV
jgi:hypothetical protein